MEKDHEEKMSFLGCLGQGIGFSHSSSQEYTFIIHNDSILYYLDLLELLSMRICVYLTNKEFLFGKEILEIFTNGIKINIIWIINSHFYK